MNRTALILAAADSGHWVTIDGHHVLVGGNAGFVPAHLRADAGEAKRFSRSGIEKALIAHHNELSGGEGGVSVAHQGEFDNAGRGIGQTTFHNKLPGEVKNYLEGNRSATRLFRVTNNAGEAGGADALHDLGEDKYFAHIDRMSGNQLSAAKETAANSPDPEMQFLNAVHSNLPAGETQSGLRQRATKLRIAAQAVTGRAREAVLGRAAEHDARANAAKGPGIVPVKAGELKVGSSFTLHGHRFAVAEDQHGMRVLQAGKDYPETPLDALKTVPVDAGSFRAGKRARAAIQAGGDDIAPFGGERLDWRKVLALGSGRLLRLSSDDDGGEWRTINGSHVLIKDGTIIKGPAHLVGKKDDGTSKRETDLERKRRTAPHTLTSSEFTSRQLHEGELATRRVWNDGKKSAPTIGEDTPERRRMYDADVKVGTAEYVDAKPGDILTHSEERKTSRSSEPLASVRDEVLPEDGEHLYHYTSHEALAGIAKKGLTPRKLGSDVLGRGGTNEKTTRGFVYGFRHSNPDYFENGVERDVSDRPAGWAVLRFKPNAKFEDDPEFTDGTPAVRAHISIEPKNVEVKTAEGWKPVSAVKVKTMTEHKAIVSDAIEAGKTVPENVLAEYPDLKKRARSLALRN